MKNLFETPQAQKQLATIGRQMQDYSEDFGKVHGLRHLKEGGLPCAERAEPSWRNALSDMV